MNTLIRKSTNNEQEQSDEREKGRKVHPPLRDVSMGVCAVFLHSPKMLPIWFLSQHIISGSMCVCRYAADR